METELGLVKKVINDLHSLTLQITIFLILFGYYIASILGAEFMCNCLTSTTLAPDKSSDFQHCYDLVCHLVICGKFQW